MRIESAGKPKPIGSPLDVNNMALDRKNLATTGDIPSCRRRSQQSTLRGELHPKESHKTKNM
jgi:hypothetical protein